MDGTAGLREIHGFETGKKLRNDPELVRRLAQAFRQAIDIVTVRMSAEAVPAMIYSALDRLKRQCEVPEVVRRSCGRTQGSHEFPSIAFALVGDLEGTRAQRRFRAGGQHHQRETRHLRKERLKLFVEHLAFIQIGQHAAIQILLRNRQHGLAPPEHSCLPPADTLLPPVGFSMVPVT